MPAELSLLALGGVLLAAFCAGCVNSIAGGGTLLTYPALVAFGVPPFPANATSTVALLPGSLASMWGYRGELRGARRWATRITFPSLTGGALGAWLFLQTPPDDFERIVPFLVLAATLLFMAQTSISAASRGRAERLADGVPLPDVADPATAPWLFFLVQFAISVYGGYFGGGIGILMLAGLGVMGFTNIHRMNGLKNWAAICMNVLAAMLFAYMGLVNWPVALTMAVGGLTGGYFGSRTAQRVGHEAVRRGVVLVGLASFVFLLIR